MATIQRSPDILAPNSVPQISGGPAPLVYIFVNPVSGGNAAAAISNIGVSHLIFSDPEIESSVFVFNIRDGEHGNKPGFHDIRERVEKHEADSVPVHVIIAGGDGTVMWAISEAIAHNVDMSKVAFGVIPYGTGNDFARSLGWGGSSPGKNIMDHGMKIFKRIIGEYLRAEIIDFDIWNISVKASENGGVIKQVKDGKKVSMKDGDLDRKTLVKPMCNYFSIGIESRIGLGFDKKRTKSAFGNKVRYAIEGLKKSMTSTPRISELIEECVVEHELGPRTVFRTSGDRSEIPRLIGDPISLIFLNINSFAAGCDLWASSSKSGIISQEKFEKSSPQLVGDGKLEILTYQKLVSLSLEQTKNKIMGGNGNRIAQEKGPIVLKFRKDIGNKRTYLQIDGEFFTLDKCESVTLSHSIVVKVLKKKSQK